MDSNEYRHHAKLCRRAAQRSTEPIRDDFLAAAEIWDMLASQLDFLTESATRGVRCYDGQVELPQRAHGR